MSISNPCAEHGGRHPATPLYRPEFEPQVRLIRRLAAKEAITEADSLKAKQQVWDNLRCTQCERMGRAHSQGPRPTGE